MRSFLELVVEDLLVHTRHQMGNAVVVVPNRRAVRMMITHLANHVEKPMWSPKVYSMDDWIVKLSGYKKLDAGLALLYLYQAYTEVTGSNQNISSFLDWGDMILTDFEDVDKYLAHPEVLFQNLTQLHEIESRFPSMEPEELESIIRFWKSFQPRPSVHQRNWLTLWEKLFQLYTRFQKEVRSDGLATSGMCYRATISLIKANQNFLHEVDRVVFVGFNALTRTEEVLFRFCQDHKKGLFYWDFDHWFGEGQRECGTLIKKFAEYFPAPDSFITRCSLEGSNFKLHTPPEIRVIAVNSSAAQNQLLIRDLQKKSQNESNESSLLKRGIVTPDENAITDVLPIWDDKLGEVNVTMGWPLAKTDIADYIRLWIQLFRQSRLGDATGLIHRTTLELIIRHGYTELTDPVGFTSLQKLLKSLGSDWILVDQIPVDHLFRTLLSPSAEEPFLMERLRILLESLRKKSDSLNNLNKQALERFEGWMEYVNIQCEKFAILPDAEFITKMMKRFLSGERIPLESAFDSPTHLTGILETRLLDFEDLYILSLNEGLWPSRALSPSLIPYSMRKAWGLPTAEHRDGMYSYYFYRLLQRAQSVTLFYLSAQTDEGGQAGEASRYITQLQYDSPFPLSFYYEKSLVVSPGQRKLEIPKSEDLLARVLGLDLPDGHSRALSPSALNMLIDCGLKFALHYGYGIKELRGAEMLDDPRNFGTLLHRVLEDVYTPTNGQEVQVTEQEINRHLNNPDSIRQRIRTAMVGEGFHVVEEQQDGLANVIMEMLYQYVTGVLRFDATQSPFEIIHLEKKMYGQIPVSLGDKRIQLNLMGLVDRLDHRDGNWVIIDYKSGKVKLNFKSFEEMFDSNKDQRPSALLQLLIYCELVHQNFPSEKPLLAGLYEVRSIRAGNPDFLMSVDHNRMVYQAHRDQFIRMLQDQLSQLLDPREPFRQTSNDKICTYCPYRTLCRRHS